MDVDSTDNIREVWVLLFQLVYKTTERTRTPHAEHNNNTQQKTLF